MSVQSQQREELLFLAAYPEISRHLSPEEKGHLAQVNKLWRDVVKEG
ncbi:MAG: hypothetical protein JJU12_02140 [Chlamydiales bacterium]|nr:hypothetical protein [Chlamydiales bacterium]